MKSHAPFLQLLDKQHNFIFGLAGASADKIQLRSKSAATRLWSQRTLIKVSHSFNAHTVIVPRSSNETADRDVEEVGI